MSDKPSNQAQPGFAVVWEFRVKPGKERRFEQAYGPDGEWVQLFGRSKGYLGTELMRDRDLRFRYMTFDRWSSRQAYLRFKKQNLEAYRKIDAKGEALTTREKLIGEFDTPWDSSKLARSLSHGQGVGGARGLRRAPAAEGRLRPRRSQR